jgi:hypothetical protein
VCAPTACVCAQSTVGPHTQNDADSDASVCMHTGSRMIACVQMDTCVCGERATSSWDVPVCVRVCVRECVQAYVCALVCALVCVLLMGVWVWVRCLLA